MTKNQTEAIKREILAANPSYRCLLGEKAWFSLSPGIRKRFGIELKKSVVYEGTMERVESSFIGKTFALITNILGKPLTPVNESNVPVTVSVYPSSSLDGMTWDRHYKFKHHKAASIQSTKCIDSNNGLMEVIGRGFGMDLTLTTEDAALCFTSTRYFFTLFARKITIPSLFTPGVTRVSQSEVDDEHFRFTLEISHPLFGVTFYQSGVFREAVKGQKSE